MADIMGWSRPVRVVGLLCWRGDRRMHAVAVRRLVLTIRLDQIKLEGKRKGYTHHHHQHQ